MTTEQQKQALDLHESYKNIPLPDLINMGVSLAPIIKSAFEAIAAGFKNRIGLRAKVDGQNERIKILEGEVLRLVESNEDAFKQLAELREYLAYQNSRQAHPTLGNPNVTWATWASSRGSNADTDALGEAH